MKVLPFAVVAVIIATSWGVLWATLRGSYWPAMALGSYWSCGLLWFLYACRKEENRDPAVFNWCLHLWPISLVEKIVARRGAA